MSNSGNIPKARVSKWSYAVVGLVAALFLYLHLFRFPFIVIWRAGDSATFLGHAERMLHGEMLYRDIFQFNLPGIEWLYLLLFRCFGVRLWIPNAMLLVAGTAATLLVYSLARLVLRGVTAFLPALAFLALCLGDSPDASHHWGSTLLVLLAINLVARRHGSGWIVIAGTLLGLATVFTSSRGAFVILGVSLFFLWLYRGSRDAIRSIAALLVPYFVVLAAVLAYLESEVGAKTLFGSLLIFPLRYYGKGDTNNISIFFDQWRWSFPFEPHSMPLLVTWFGINLATPLILIAFIAKLVMWRAADLRDSRGTQALVLFTFAGAFALLAVCAAPASHRLNCATAFAYLLGAVLLAESGGLRLARGMLCVIGLWAIAETSYNAVRPVFVFTGTRGTIALSRHDTYEYMEWLEHNARVGDSYFGEPAASWILGLRNPAKVEWVESDAYTRPEQVRDLIRVLDESHTRFISPIPEAQSGASSGDNLQALRTYATQHYHLAYHAGGFGDILANNITDPPDR